MTPYYQHAGITIYHADCREVLPQLSCYWIIADPPYGANKAEWDSEFALDWLELSAHAALDGLVVMPGIRNLLAMPRKVGLRRHSYRWTLAIHLINGTTRGDMGFGNWIPALVYARDGLNIYAPQQDCTDIAIGHEPMPLHPSPKPLTAMFWLLSRLPAGAILDPFAGSGTTLVAAKNLNRHAIGIEIEERYCEIAAQRLAQEILPFEPLPNIEQLDLIA